MPITIKCPCGKSLRVADEYAGRRVKCPACQAVTSVPAPEPAFEVVEEASEPFVAPAPAPAPVTARPVAKPARSRADEDEEEDDRRAAKRDRDDEPRAKKPPNFRRGSGRPGEDDEDEDDDRPRKRKKRPPEQTSSSFEGKVFNGGVWGGLLAMVGAVVWFVAGLLNDYIFFYPPILFIIGLVAFIKGLIGKE